MQINYHDLSEDQFERLVVAICIYLFGEGVQGFCKGPDGGKDARFVGRAERFPSSSGPWDGRMVIQAKHTDLINRKFSEQEFSSNAASSVLSKELPKITQMRTAGELDYYLLFSNRRLAGVAEENIRKRIATAAGIPDTAVHLFGEEALNQYLAMEPAILNWAGIGLFDIVPTPDPSDLARVIRALADGLGVLQAQSSSDTPPPERRILLAEKNIINGLSEEYARVVEQYIKEFSPVESFLAAPENAAHQRYYKDAAQELEDFVRIHRKEHHSFDRVLDKLLRLLFDRDYDLRGNKRLTRTLFYYMYWNCDLGSEGHA